MGDGSLVENFAGILAAEPDVEVVIVHFIGRRPEYSPTHAPGDSVRAEFSEALGGFVKIKERDLGVIRIAGEQEVAGGEAVFGVLRPDPGGETAVKRKLEVDP